MGLFEDIELVEKKVKKSTTKKPSTGHKQPKAAAPRKVFDLKKILAFLESKDYRAITTGTQALQAAKEILAYAKQGECIAYDEEDDVIPGKTGRWLLCVGASPKPGLSYVFVLDHPENPASLEDKRIVRRVVKALVEDPHEKAMHHGNHDAGIFKRLLGAEVKGFSLDTQYATYFVDSSQRGYSLSAIVDRTLPEYADYKELVTEAVPEGMTVEEGREVGEFHVARVPLYKTILYNGADCDVTGQLATLAKKHKVPLPLVCVYTDAAFVIDEMQAFGPLLDYDQYNTMSGIYPQRKEWFANQLRMLSSSPDLNPNSFPQMKEVIYETWGLEPVNKKADTAGETLELLQQMHLLAHSKKHTGVSMLQDYREAKNRVERIEAFKRSADAHGGRITTFWWLCGARTGRLSSGGGTRPDRRNLGNLQNIPSDDHIKNMLVSDVCWREFYNAAMKGATKRKNSEGKEIYVLPHLNSACREFEDLDFFVASDYGQMEMRILCQITQDPELIRIFTEGLDIHAAIGSLWTGWTFEEIQTDEKKRVIVKGLHFGVVYGLTVNGLHQDLLAKGVRITRAEVAKLHAQYFKTMKRVKKYAEQQPEFARAHGYVENLFGFRVPIDVKEGNYSGARWENQSLNSPIQGAAHQVMLVCIALLKRFREKYSLIRPQMEIHDSLITITPMKKLKPTISILQQLLEKDGPQTIEEEFGIKWSVPFVAEAKIGLRYGGLVKVKGTLLEAIQEVVLKVATQDRDLKRLQAEYV